MEMLQNKKKKRNEKRRFTFRTGAEDAGGRVVADVAAVVAAVAAEVVGAAQAFVGAVAAVDDAVADPVRLRGQKKKINVTSTFQWTTTKTLRTRLPQTRLEWFVGEYSKIPPQVQLFYFWLNE